MVMYSMRAEHQGNRHGRPVLRWGAVMAPIPQERHPACALTIGVRQRLGLAVPVPLLERLDLIEPPQPLSSLAIKLKASRRQLRLLALRQLPRLVLAALLGGPASKLCVVAVAAAHVRITMPANKGKTSAQGMSLTARCQLAVPVNRLGGRRLSVLSAGRPRHKSADTRHSHGLLLQL